MSFGGALVLKLGKECAIEISSPLKGTPIAFPTDLKMASAEQSLDSLMPVIFQAVSA
jgi:hypothetical protein